MFRKALIAVAGMLIATVSLADGRSAGHNFFANMARANSRISINESNAVVRNTLVRGLYAIMDQQGQFKGLTNEAGNIFAGKSGFSLLPSGGGAIRPLTASEVAELRAEVMASIEYEKLPRVTYGNGGGRQLLLYSALDCAFCKLFEDNLGKNSAGLNTTIYVLPSSLQEIRGGGLNKWQAVSRIWCAADPGAAWRVYWTTRGLPPEPGQCAFADPHAAEFLSESLVWVLNGAGVKLIATPKIVREDGALIEPRPDMSRAYIHASFGPGSAPPVVRPAVMKWLSAVPFDGARGPSSTQSVQQSRQPAQQNQRISSRDVLNGLFGGGAVNPGQSSGATSAEETR